MVGYPTEERIEDYFYELRDKIIAEYIRVQIAKKVEAKASDFDGQRKNEIVTVIFADLLSLFSKCQRFRFV